MIKAKTSREEKLNILVNVVLFQVCESLLCTNLSWSTSPNLVVEYAMRLRPFLLEEFDMLFTEDDLKDMDFKNENNILIKKMAEFVDSDRCTTILQHVAKETKESIKNSEKQ